MIRSPYNSGITDVQGKVWSCVHLPLKRTDLGNIKLEVKVPTWEYV